jgi:Flp pilus assembly protein TadD
MSPPSPPALQQPAPESPEALRQRLGALYQAKQWEALADAFEALPPKERGRWLVDWVEAIFRAGRFARVAEVTEAALGQVQPQDPRTPILRLQHARALTRLERHGEAGLAWERMGGPSDLGNALAEFRNARDWPAFERVAGALLTQAKDPESTTKAKGLLGEGIARQDRFPEAEPLLQAAADAGSREPFVWSNLGRCLNERKAWSASHEACTKALSLDPGLMEALYNRGRAAFELKRYAEAVADFQGALALLPGDAVLQENLRQAQRYANPRGTAGSKPRK